jgi:hypothetical protein
MPAGRWRSAGTVASKRLPMALLLITSSALQISIGCVPVALAGLLFEHPRFEALSAVGWALLAYMTVIGFGFTLAGVALATRS